MEEMIQLDTIKWKIKLRTEKWEVRESVSNVSDNFLMLENIE